MKVFDQPRPCSSCGRFDSMAMLGATTVLKRGKPLFPSRALIYCRHCMVSHGEHLVVLKPLMDVTWDDLRNYIRQGYLNLGVLDVTLGDEIQKRLTDELDRKVLVEAAKRLGKSKEEIKFLLNRISYHDLYEFLHPDADEVIRLAVPKPGGK